MDDLVAGWRASSRRFFPALPRRVPAAGRRGPAAAARCSSAARTRAWCRTCSPAPGRATCSSCATSATSSRPTTPSRGDHGTARRSSSRSASSACATSCVCGHSHCGAIRALYDEPLPEPTAAPRTAGSTSRATPCCRSPSSEEALRRTEQRSIVLQIERLLGYPMVAAAVRARARLFLHGWHYVIEDGRVLVLDVESGAFVPTDVALAEQRRGRRSGALPAAVAAADQRVTPVPVARARRGLPAAGGRDRRGQVTRRAGQRLGRGRDLWNNRRQPNSIQG